MIFENSIRRNARKTASLDARLSMATIIDLDEANMKKWDD